MPPDGWEIERKFLVDSAPAALDAYPADPIRQGYLPPAQDGTAVRLREQGDAYVLTVKQGAGMRRAEVEVALTPDQFAALWPLTEGRRLEKTRYAIPHGAYTIELDVYHGPLAPLVTAEVEFGSADEGRAFEPPPWMGEEVTDDARYTNLHLALHGAPPRR